MKFYYNGKLMRTSKTHEYKFAIINASGSCWSCHGTREAAEKEYRKAIANREDQIKRAKRAISMINKGIFTYREQDGRYSYEVNLKKEYWDHEDHASVEYWERRIDGLNADIKKYNSRKIVELEAREK